MLCVSNAYLTYIVIPFHVPVESSLTFAPSPLDLQPVPKAKREDYGEVEEQREVDLLLTILPPLEPTSEPTPSDVVAAVLGQLVPIEEVVESGGEGVASPVEPELFLEPGGKVEPSSPPQAQTLPPVAEHIFQTPPATMSTLDSRARFYERFVVKSPQRHPQHSSETKGFLQQGLGEGG